jgi:micrococcal nuclease
MRRSDGITVGGSFSDGHTDTLRLLGVDTPETHHPTMGVECYGPEAAAFTAAPDGGESSGLKETSRRDQYDRRLAYVIAGGRRFNDASLAHTRAPRDRTERRARPRPTSRPS